MYLYPLLSAPYIFFCQVHFTASQKGTLHEFLGGEKVSLNEKYLNVITFEYADNLLYKCNLFFKLISYKFYSSKENCLSGLLQLSSPNGNLNMVAQSYSVPLK